jgi:hypothetical protein
MGLARHIPSAEAEGARFEGERFIYEGRGGVRGSGGRPGLDVGWGEGAREGSGQRGMDGG